MDRLTTSTAGDDGDEAIQGKELRGVEMRHFDRIELCFLMKWLNRESFEKTLAGTWR